MSNQHDWRAVVERLKAQAQIAEGHAQSFYRAGLRTEADTAWGRSDAYGNSARIVEEMLGDLNEGEKQ